MPLRFGLLGCGRIARSHGAALRALPDRTQLVAVADPDSGRAQALAAQLGGVAVFPDLQAMVRAAALDAVIVCTPNKLHAAHSIEALRAGLHVLVEKPMADNAIDAERMAAAARATGKVLALGQTFRHCEPIRYLQDHRHEWGRLRAVEVSMCVHWNGPQAPWWATRSPREGLILSLYAPHALDFVQLALEGRVAERVHCEAARHQTGWQGEDEAMILLRYPGNCLASVHISYNQPFVVDHKTLHFERAMVRIENGEQLWVDGQQIMGPGLPDVQLQRMGRRELGGYFTTQLREFIAAVRGEPHRAVLSDEGVRLTALLDRVLAAANESTGC